MKISCFTVMQGQLPLEEIFPNLAKDGYDGIELMGNTPHLHPDTPMERVEEIKALSDKYKIPVIGIANYGGGYALPNEEHCQKQLVDLEKHLKMMKVLGCDMIRHSPGGRHHPMDRQTFQSHPEDIARGAEWMKKACDLAAKYDVRIVMEIHNAGLIESAEEAMDMVKRIDRANLGIIHDAGNMYVSTTDHSEYSVEVLGDRLVHVHVKDVLRVADEKIPGAAYYPTRNGRELFVVTLLDQGGTDHRPLFRGLKASGYNGYISLECFLAGNDPSVPGKEITALKKIMKEIGI